MRRESPFYIFSPRALSVDVPFRRDSGIPSLACVSRLLLWESTHVAPHMAPLAARAQADGTGRLAALAPRFTGSHDPARSLHPPDLSGAAGRPMRAVAR